MDVGLFVYNFAFLEKKCCKKSIKIHDLKAFELQLEQ